MITYPKQWRTRWVEFFLNYIAQINFRKIKVDCSEFVFETDIVLSKFHILFLKCISSLVWSDREIEENLYLKFNGIAALLLVTQIKYEINVFVSFNTVH